MQFPQLRAPTGSTPCKVNKKDGQPRLTVLTCFGGPSGGQPAAQAAAAAPRRLARYAGKCLRISSAPRSDGFDPMKGQQKSDQPKPVALQCFGGPSGGRTLDLGIKSLERDVLARVISAKLQVPMISPAPYALKLHWRTVINGYQVMHKTPPRNMPGRGLVIYGRLTLTMQNATVVTTPPNNAPKTNASAIIDVFRPRRNTAADRGHSHRCRHSRRRHRSFHRRKPHRGSRDEQHPGCGSRPACTRQTV